MLCMIPVSTRACLKSQHGLGRNTAVIMVLMCVCVCVCVPVCVRVRARARARVRARLCHAVLLTLCRILSCSQCCREYLSSTSCCHSATLSHIPLLARGPLHRNGSSNFISLNYDVLLAAKNPRLTHLWAYISRACMCQRTHTHKKKCSCAHEITFLGGTNKCQVRVVGNLECVQFQTGWLTHVYTVQGGTHLPSKHQNISAKGR